MIQHNEIRKGSGLFTLQHSAQFVLIGWTRRK